MRRRWNTHRSSGYRSRFEELVALYLKGQGATFSYESMKLDYERKCTYTPDFILPNGVIIEAKGRWLGSDRTKHLAVRKNNPHIDIRFCFQNAYNKLTKKSKTTYAEWCDKNDFLWCHQKIPKEWLI